MTKYNYSVGKRKTASAQVKLFEGNGENTVNGKKINEYISRSDLFDYVYLPLKITKTMTKVYFDVKVSGSGISSQAQAIRHGLSKALVLKDSGLRGILKKSGLLTRDARIVERKKPGKHKARKSIQWSKR